MASLTLHELADRYWQGQLSEREEQHLFSLLNEANDLPAELEELRTYTSLMAQQRQTHRVPVDFDANLMAQVRATASPRRPLWERLTPLAAVFALLLGISLSWEQLVPGPALQEQKEFVDTYEDPEEAYRAVKAALMKVSTTMNQGMAHTDMLTTFHEAQTTISSQE